MLTRLQVKGFKNLIDVDVRLGPLTCIAGLNGVGKSNLFDAIEFLRHLADKPFVEAAQEVRGGLDLRELFTVGHEPRMELAAEMLIPPEGIDDFGQPARASATYLRYELALTLDRGPDEQLGERIRLEHEALSYITKGNAKAQLGFRTTRDWLDSVIPASRRTTTFIKTERAGTPDAVVRLQSDRMGDEDKTKRGGGKAQGFALDRLPRTVLSSAQNADETRTAVLVRREMRSWRRLQLEPSALRRPDDFQSPDRLDPSGAHIPATLYRLAHAHGDPERAYAATANRLARLVSGVNSVRVDRDPTRRLLRFMLTDQQGLELPASSLSDGTMRLAALSVLEQDPDANGVICLEEPENGMHPQRVEAIVDLLYEIAVDSARPVDATNPLRQVVIATHSPLVAGRVDIHDLVFARGRRHRRNGHRVPGLDVQALAGTWRTKPDGDGSPGSASVRRGEVLAYLTGEPLPEAIRAEPAADTVRAHYQPDLPNVPREPP